jgi:hypothetical protein
MIPAHIKWVVGPNLGLTDQSLEEAKRLFAASGKKVEVGGFVKLLILCGSDTDCRGERIWIKVTRIDGEKVFGTVANDPLYFPPDMLKEHDLIQTTFDQILDYYAP